MTRREQREADLVCALLPGSRARTTLSGMASFMKLRLTGALVVAAMLAAPPSVTAQVDLEMALTRDVATAAPSLPLGPAGLTETRETTTLQRGVTLTTIVRGAADPAQVWTVEVSIPAGETSPDPDAPPAGMRARACGHA